MALSNCNACHHNHHANPLRRGELLAECQPSDGNGHHGAEQAQRCQGRRTEPRSRHAFDGPNFELRQLDPNVAIPFLNQTSGSAINARNMRMEACSPIEARHTAGAQDCEYDIAWTNTYLIGIDYTATANRCGNAVINRHCAPASRFQRFLAGVPNTRAAAFRQSATEVGAEGLITIATSTTTATFLGPQGDRHLYRGGTAPDPPIEIRAGHARTGHDGGSGGRWAARAGGAGNGAAVHGAAR